LTSIRLEQYTKVLVSFIVSLQVKKFYFSQYVSEKSTNSPGQPGWFDQNPSEGIAQNPLLQITSFCTGKEAPHFGTAELEEG